MGETSSAGLMPLLFVGHGSPMNAIEDNQFSQSWNSIAQKIPKPEAILCISAHWLTTDVHVCAVEEPKTIHDFSGFPEALYQVQYPAPGHPVLAKMVQEALGPNVRLDYEWGLDHGSWSVLKAMYPKADIPVVQLSLDIRKPASFHYELAKNLALLRNEGVLIMGSGNAVHNLGKLSYFHQGGFDWAMDMNEVIKRKISDGDHQSLIDYQNLGPESRLAIPSLDHYLPMLYVLANTIKGESISFFNDDVVMGSISMMSFSIGVTKEMGLYKA